MSRHILLISLSNIGDAVLTTPVLQSLHDHYPESIIDIVADQRSGIIFRHCPYRGDIYYKNKRSFLRGGPELVRQLRARRYDLIVDLRTDGLAWFLRAGKRYTRWNGTPYGPHAVERHMGIIRSLHGAETLPDCRIWLDKEDENEAEKLLGEQNGKKLLALGPGANYPGKIWPAAAFTKLIQLLRQQFDAVVLLGDRNDKPSAALIAAQSVLPCINLCDETTLLTASAVIKRASVFVGNDSGLGHLASAVNTATVSLFGIGQPERYRPWGRKAKWLIGSDQKIENISVAEVGAAASQQVPPALSEQK